MRHLTRLTAGFVLLALALAPQALDAQGKPPTVKEIMGKLHKGANSALTVVRADLQDEQPNWPDVQKNARDFVVLGGALGKNDPPRGDRASWVKLTAQYLECAKALEAAAQQKNKAQALAAHSRLNDTCKGCHAAHRPD